MAADESGEKGMNLSAIVSIKAAKMLQRVDTPILTHTSSLASSSIALIYKPIVLPSRLART